MIVFSQRSNRKKQKNVRMQYGTRHTRCIKNIQNCMSFFRSSRFFLFFLFLLFDKTSFFVFCAICFIIVVVDRKNLVTVHNALTTTLYVCVYVFRFPGTLMLSLLLFHLSIQSLIDSHLVCPFFTTGAPFISLHVQT